MYETINKFMMDHFYLYYWFMIVPLYMILRMAKRFGRLSFEEFPERYTEEELTELRKKYKRPFWYSWL